MKKTFRNGDDEVRPRVRPVYDWTCNDPTRVLLYHHYTYECEHTTTQGFLLFFVSLLRRV